jgi:DNA invertase Pin-like site-specific DNA recombinase
MKQKRRVIELIRVSTEGQAGEDRASIPAQRAVNKRTAQVYELDIVRSIEFSDVSGAAVLLAPEIKELLFLMADPQIHGVVTREFSRLMRPENFSDYALLQAFSDTNTILYLPDGPIDMANKTGRLIGTIRAAIAGMERVEILERVWTAKEQKRRAGELAQSEICLPFGVGFKQKKWHYKPEAERVRQAFRMFLSGNTSYSSVGEKVGIDPYSLRVILRNPIYTGWRVIDKRRDPSPGARRVGVNGRQADRPKIQRPPEDIIRIKVIDEPLVKEGDFLRVQRLMDIKKKRHWRTRKDYVHRYTYNGFLTCAVCGDLVYTHYRRADYYVCKARKLKGACASGYMRLDKLEPALDSLFADRLTDGGFLRALAAEMQERAGRQTGALEAKRLQSQLVSLGAKRERVLDAYFEGLIDSSQRDAKLGEVDRAIATAEELLRRERPDTAVTADSLAEVFSPFFEYSLLDREDKRRLLSAIAPEIHVADYRIHGITLLPTLTRGDEVSPTGKDSSQRRA